MPRNTFRPFSLQSAFTADPIEPEGLMINTEVPLSSTSTTELIAPPKELTTGVTELTVISVNPEQHRQCGCSRCMGRLRRTNINTLTISNEAIDKKLNWILTLVVFMFILLIVHIRSQTNTK